MNLHIESWLHPGPRCLSAVLFDGILQYISYQVHFTQANPGYTSFTTLDRSWTISTLALNPAYTTEIPRLTRRLCGSHLRATRSTRSLQYFPQRTPQATTMQVYGLTSCTVVWEVMNSINVGLLFPALLGNFASMDVIRIPCLVSTMLCILFSDVNSPYSTSPSTFLNDLDYEAHATPASVSV